MYKCKVKQMSIENYIKFFNEALYPINYPYHLRYGLRVNKIPTIIVQIHINNGDNNEPWFRDILEIYGDTEEEILMKMKEVEDKWIRHKHLEDYKDLWNM